MEDRPYAKGKLVYYRVWRDEDGRVQHVVKPGARPIWVLGDPGPPTHVRWAIEKRRSKYAHPVEVIASGRVDLRPREERENG